MSSRALAAAAAAVVALAAAPAPAAAALVDPQPRQAAAISVALEHARGYWRADICAGAWRVQFDTALPERDTAGEATGVSVRADGSWSITACTFTLAPALRGCGLEAIVVHEVGHFVHGPGHEGAMAPDALAAAPCSRATRELERATRERVKARWRRDRDPRRFNH